MTRPPPNPRTPGELRPEAAGGGWVAPGCERRAVSVLGVLPEVAEPLLLLPLVPAGLGATRGRWEVGLVRSSREPWGRCPSRARWVSQATL